MTLVRALSLDEALADDDNVLADLHVEVDTIDVDLVQRGVIRVLPGGRLSVGRMSAP